MGTRSDWKMEVSITETTIIKPSSPTPNHLQTVQLSYFDQFALPFYVNVILFYTNPTSKPNHEICRGLKASLSDTLSRFYPFAGRLEGHKFINCNDQGAQFVEAGVNCSLVDVLRHPDTDQLNLLHPEGTTSSVESKLLTVQANFFDCGGIGLSVCIWHKLGDAYTLGTFIKEWTAAATGLHQSVVPEFNGSMLYPPIDFSIPCSIHQEKFIRQRFVFDASKIALLKNKIASGGNIKPTRVEAITALIWKTAMAATGSGTSIWSHIVNMRKRIVPPLSDGLMGNVACSFIAKKTENESDEEEMNLLVGKLRRGIKVVEEDEYVKRFQGVEGFSVYCQINSEISEMMTRFDRNLYMCTSWCRFPFYEANFGWGRPKWVTSTTVFCNITSSILLMDTANGDDIEVWVVLPEKDMAMFECNEELLSFATLNPNVTI